MKIDMTDAAAVLSEHIERIEQLESELARTQAEAAAMRKRAELDEVTSLLSIIEVELNAWHTSGRADDQKSGAVEALNDLRALVRGRREMKLAALDEDATK